MEKLEPSRFNVFVPIDDGSTFLLNSWSRRAIIIEATAASALQNGECVPEKIIPALVEIGALTEEPDGQQNDVFNAFDDEKFSRDELTVVIPLTNKCNLMCGYCYQIQHGDFQGDEPKQIQGWDTDKILAVKQFIFNKMSDEKYSSVRVRWYGGEPLLRQDLIQRLGAEIREAVETNGKRLCGTVITNGVLITPKTVELLSSVGVDRLEISIDGPQEVHDAHRSSRNGKSTYERVIRNLLFAADRFSTIVFRVNIHADTVKLVPSWLKKISETIARENIYLKFKLVEGLKDNTLSWPDFCEISSDFTGLARLLGLNVIQTKLTTELCPAIREDYHIVQSDLKVYKCPQNLGSEMHVGTITEHGMLSETRFSAPWREYSVRKDAACASCNHLPHCNGGCPYNAIMSTIESNDLDVYSRKEGCCVEKFAPQRILARSV
ncbi:radical SAM/SPASM domain-containing protein [Shimia sp. MMG029]|uniref:radical SAM/SPASM domain-containing protein n=1 Tax=Shimia sp. MMG029 TaxID=3021978 RepID=UPI0022FF1D4B|nr:radical SAM protein [Shimia sp. MMG029]MDA5556030.1 radical SAM protein [Shimia sp. MMG029]